MLDATGMDPVAKNAVFTVLCSGSELAQHGESQFDVFVGVQRILVGRNWPLCKNVFCVNPHSNLQQFAEGGSDHGAGDLAQESHQELSGSVD